MANNYILTSTGSFISEDELYHHGIKGMKWGVRKYQELKGLSTSVRSKIADSDYSRISSHRKKSLGRKYARTVIAGAVGSMSVNLASHTMLHMKYKTGKRFVKSMTRSAVFGASVASLMSAARMGSDDSDD